MKEIKNSLKFAARVLRGAEVHGRPPQMLVGKR